MARLWVKVWNALQVVCDIAEEDEELTINGKYWWGEGWEEYERIYVLLLN